MISLVISILISLGTLIAPADWDNLTQQQQDDYIEIIIDDETIY